MILTSMSVISPATRAMTDSELMLMLAMREGSDEALDTLFHRYARLVYRIAAEPIESIAEVRQLPPRLTPDECRWLLRSGLAQLPEKQRTTLELTCFEDLTLRDVAGRLGVSVGCTRHYYYRGLARLQRWARITGSARTTRSRTVSPDDRADAATVRAPLPCDPA